MSDCIIEAKELVLNYGKYTALDGVNFIIDKPVIMGVVGKNGAGKSSLMRIINGWEKPSSGQMLINGRSPYDNGKILNNAIFIDEKIEFDFTLTLDRILEKCAFMDERFNLDYAHGLTEKFGLNLKKRQSQLSKGMRNQFALIIGLAFNRPITIMDEPVSGLDEGARRLFYSLLVQAQCENPRIFIITTHLLGEFEKYADMFMVLNNGKVVAYDKRETFETLFVRVSGNADNVDRVIKGLETFDVKTLASIKSVTVPNLLTREKKSFAADNGVNVKSIGVDDACVILGGLLL